MRLRNSIIAVLMLALAAGAWLCASPSAEHDSPIRIWTARKIITMEPDLPAATAVATQGGWIAAVGSLAQVKAALGDQPFEVDASFAEKVILPGFIDPHLHPSLAATILPLEIVSRLRPESRGATSSTRTATTRSPGTASRPPSSRCRSPP